MTTTAEARTTCPAFCVSPHDEPADVEPVHLDQAAYVESLDGDVRVDVQQLAGSAEATVYVDDRAYTATQANALIAAIAARVYLIQAAGR